MKLEVPKYIENESSFELEEMLHPMEPREKAVFHTRNKHNYSALTEFKTRDKVKHTNN